MRDICCGPESNGDDVRCMCGSLLARLVPGGVELKCRRCHRTQLVPLEQAMPLDQAVPLEHGVPEQRPRG
ncbi:hypothetical protein [Hyalangium versicolor]|uniref:hypothetical protein n=1 Tax=Hyalangium versicolor TaxID=2861190 RepID=UPI001CCBF975|nr:hypothetical protein [Hyalangium versicolor]